MKPNSFVQRAIAVIAFATAAAYVESACVVYLQRALFINPDDLFPLIGSHVVGNLAAIEVGREAATLVMLASIGFLAGRGRIDRLAWTAVAFGTWDILYYFWLWVFIGWPHSPLTWDVLFLIPLPWTGPVWAPVAVSAALIGFGLAAGQRTEAGRPVQVGAREWLIAIAGGVVVVLSFLANAPALMDGGIPGFFPWPVFAVGMALAAWAASVSLRARAVPQPVE